MCSFFFTHELVIQFQANLETRTNFFIFVKLSVELQIRMMVSSSRLVNITRDGPIDRTLTIRCTTINGTAFADRDFSPFDFQLIFSAGERSREVNISTVDSRTPQPDESFYVIISDISGKQIQCRC